MPSPLDNEGLQEYLSIPEDLSKYNKQELLDMNPSGASVIPNSWNERKIRDALLIKKNTCLQYINQYKNELIKYQIGTLITINSLGDTYLINEFSVNEGFSITFKLIELKFQMVTNKVTKEVEPQIRRINRVFSPLFTCVDISSLKKNTKIKTIIKPALVILLNQLE
jgi:hypothetical protein